MAKRLQSQQGKGKKKNRSIEDSQVVPYLSTNSTITDLTSQIGRDAVLSSVYGRGWRQSAALAHELILSCASKRKKAAAGDRQTGLSRLQRGELKGWRRILT